MKSIKPLVTVSAAAALALVATLATVASASSPRSPEPTNLAAGACFDQANMQAALNQLRAARASLSNAEHNKGGWRDNAEKATDNAIAETVRGCAFAK